MTRPFNFTAWNNFQDQPVAHPGKLFDRTDNDAHSGVPQGGPAPYGRVLVRGIASHQSTNADRDLSARYFTFDDAVSLPDADGAYLMTDAGQTYADAGLALPVDTDGELIVAGIGIWTEFGSCLNRALEQPIGLGDTDYQPEKCGQVGMCIEGNIWAYCETDIDVGDKLWFRTVIDDAADGVQILGGFNNAGIGQPFHFGSVFRGGPAGGAFVLTMNLQK